MRTKHIIGGLAVIALAAGTYVMQSHRTGPADIYPPSWTTGAINADITQANIGDTICNPQWSTKSERPLVSYTNSMKVQQISIMQLKDTNLADYEEDHLISLELGGSPTSTHNLWPEPYNASVSDGGAKSKDTVENYLHSRICQGLMSLKDAQSQIVSDWYAVAQQLKGRLGSVDGLDNDDQ